MQTSRSTSEQEANQALRTLRLTLSAGAAALLVLGLIFLDPIGKIACTIVVLAVLHGLWRGSADVAGMLAGTALAVFTAVPMAPWFEGITRWMFGFSGLANRVAATIIGGAIVLLLVGVVVSTLLRKLVRAKEGWSRWDSLLGAALGAAEGAILALAVTWTPVALAPLARAQLAQLQAAASPTGSGQGRIPVQAPQRDDNLSTARFVVGAADAVQRSPLADLSEATNPIKGGRLIGLTEDFLQVLSNDAMREHFLNSTVMREIDAMGSVKRALEIIRADTALTEVLKDGASEDAVMALLKSDTVMRAIDQTAVVSELAGLTPRIADAIEAARTSVKK